ncbi:hypothetical protein JCM19237_4981 [Photobacterium aphoticum]|uniref:Uncharacterized protein n=1 Tax=Photobacterium aphoticum TaxID=754436 RepID=A0A090QIM6_9GAMM|nr:hypothetical protein JCM19237_4981 [Photobacterium aphoticum]
MDAFILCACDLIIVKQAHIAFIQKVFTICKMIFAQGLACMSIELNDRFWLKPSLFQTNR